MFCELFKRLVADFIESNFVEGQPRGEMAGAIVIAAYGQARMAKRPEFGGKCSDPRREVASLHFSGDLG
jgi:hypothetical protein